MKIYEELLNIEHDDLSGKVFPPLVVLGYLNEKRSERWYYVRCDICSLDPDLYKTGVFLVNKAQLLKGGLPCGYTETTYIYNIDTIIKIYEDNGGTKVEK